MDTTEKMAKSYLERQGHQNILYEPDGNVPPDFLVDGSVAVEVRRLNQHEDGEDGPEALEAVEYPLLRLFQRVLPEMGPPSANSSFFVMYTYRRPLPPWKVVEGALRERLQEFCAAPQDRVEFEVVENLHIDFIRASSVDPAFLLLGGSVDLDSGGFILAELNKNIRLCVADKTKKVAKVRDRYPTWWLLLVDYVAHGLAVEDHEPLRRLLQGEHGWDKIVVVNPTDPSRSFELQIDPSRAGGLDRQ